MAPLTWREVSAPNFSGVSESQRLTAQLLQNGFGGLQDAISNFKKTRNDAASSSFLAGISRYTDPASLNAALQSGDAYNGVDPSTISPEAIKFATGRQAELLNNQNQGLVNDHTQFANNTAQRDDAQAQARLAAQGPAADLLAQVQTLAGSGDPAKVEEARGLISKNNQTLLNAGYKADAIPGLLDAARGTGTAGFGYKKDLLANDKFWEDQGVTKSARDLAFKQINGSVTPELAIRSIQNDNSIKDPRIKAQAIEVINQSADAKVFSTPDQGSILLQTLTGQTSVPQAIPPQTAAPQSPAPQGGGIQNPLSQLVDAKEGAGNYSTLYGHAQKDGGAFAGVDVSKQTIGQLKQFASSDGAYGQHQKNQLGYLATPMGRYQIVGQTMVNTAKEMGLPDNTVFTANVQDAMFQHIADKALSGPRSMAGKMAALRGQWDGFRSVSDSALSAAITAYQNGDRGQLGNITNGQSTGNTPQAINAGAFPRGGQATMDQMLSSQRLGGAANGPVTITDGGAPINAGAFPPGNSLAELSRPQITLPVGSTTNTDVAAAPAPTPVEQIAAAAAAGSPAAAPTGLERLASWFPGLGGRAAAAGQDPAAQLAQSAAPTPAPAAASAAPANNGNTDTPAQSAQKLLDQGTIDQASNADAPLFAQISQAQSSTDSVNQVMKKLIAPGGALEGMNEQNVLQTLNDTIKASGGRLKPAAAGAIIAQNPVSQNLQSWTHYIPIVGGLTDAYFSGDRFGASENGGTSARRIDMNGVQKTLNKIGYNVDGSIQLARGAAGIAAQRSANYSTDQVKAIQGQVLSNQIQISQIQQAIAKGNNDPQLLQVLANLQAQQQTFSAILNQIGAEPGSPTSQFSGQGEQPRPQ